jgi:hypothetical protein
VGVIAGIVIFFCAVYIGNAIKNSGWLEPQVAAAVDSKIFAPSTELVQDKASESQELYSLVKSLNTEIEKIVFAPEVLTAKVSDAFAVEKNKVDAKDENKNEKQKETSAKITANPEKLPRQLTERKNLLIALAKTDPRAFTLSSLSDSVLAKIPEALRKELERNVTVTGIIDAIQFDDFNKHENSRVEYFITVGNEKYSLYPTNDLSVISGGTFKVTGKKIGNSIVAENKDIERVSNFGGPMDGPADGPSSPSDSVPPDSVGDQKTLVMLIRYQDSPPVPVSNQQAYDVIFKGQFQKFYQEQSYGKASFSGKVVGWYTLPRSCNSIWPTYGSQSTHEIENLLIANHIDLSDYSHLLVVPQTTDGTEGCLSISRGFSTLGKITLPVGEKKYKVSVTYAAISNYFLSNPIGLSSFPPPFISIFDYLVTHEMGHALGIVHANGLDCGGVTLATNCDHFEYGNSFDMMGGSGSSLHFNAFYKELLGWIPVQDTITITKSGRYTINPLETSGPNKKNFAKIQRLNSVSTPIYLEFRKGIGFDGWLNQTLFSSNQSGLLVNLIRKNPEGVASFPHLLDMSATSQSWYQDIQAATLDVGKEFNDPGNGIKIGPVISVSTSTVTFDVAINKPVCVPRSPVTWIFPPVSLSLASGQTGQVNLSFQNGDSITCDDSKFNVETNAPSSWQRQIIPAGDVGLKPRESYYQEASKNINLTVPSGTPTGTYPTTFSVVNKSTGYRKDYQININVAGAPVIYNIQPWSGPVGMPTVISGLGFGSFPKVIMIGQEGRLSTNFPSNGSSINFPIPTTVIEPFCNCSIPTPPGFYDVYVYASGMLSSPVTLQVTQ